MRLLNLRDDTRPVLTETEAGPRDIVAPAGNRIGYRPCPLGNRRVGELPDWIKEFVNAKAL